MIRKNKSIYIVLIIVLLIGVTIGYAVINSTLNINGKSNISKNTWDVYFDNVVVKDDSVEAVKIPTVTDKTTVDFEVALNLPGDFYEFTVDVVNAGSIDAMIESITKEPELTEAQQKYLNYTIAYENYEAITTKQLVEKEEFVRLKVRVEYKSDITASDLPQSTETLNLGFLLNYVQSDGTGVSVNNNGIKVKPVANGSLDEIGTIVTIGDQQFYTIGTEGENVKLLSMYNLYVGGEFNYDTGVWTAYGDEATGKQDSTMLGYVSGQSVRKGTTEFSSDTQKGTKYTDYNGSIVEGYVNAYKDILEGEEYGIDVVEARLITKEELTSNDIGCNLDDYTSSGTCSGAPSFIYSTSYWSGSAYVDNVVLFVSSIGSFVYNYYFYDREFGVRPVIVIPKSYITGTTNKNIANLIIDDVTYQVEEGMTWREWINSSYNTNNLFKFDEVEYVYNSSNNLQLQQCVKSDDVIDKNVAYNIFPSSGIECNPFE